MTIITGIFAGLHDGDHPSSIHVTVHVPHVDGSFPVISTQPLFNLTHALDCGTACTQQVRCSSLTLGSVLARQSGFVEWAAGGEGLEGLQPYQHSEAVRGQETVMLYRYHIDSVSKHACATCIEKKNFLNIGLCCLNIIIM